MIGICQEKFSMTYDKDSLLLSETTRRINNALRDRIIMPHSADSLRLEILSVDALYLHHLLQGVIDDLDSLYNATIELENKYAEREMLLYRGILPSILVIPDDYISPEERRWQAEEEASKRVNETISILLKNHPRPFFKRFFSSSSPNYSGKEYGLQGRAIPQRGGLYYIYIPAAPNTPYNTYGTNKYQPLYRLEYSEKSRRYEEVKD